MELKHWQLLTIITIIITSCISQQGSETNAIESYYFEKTGHTVKGDFLQFFITYGGVQSLGYPLTEEIIVDGWTVQYFEKGRLERHPENDPAYRITVGWLGDLLHRRRPPLSPANISDLNTPNYRYFPQTGHTLSGDFLNYFNANKGSLRFGLPISEPFLWEGKLAQDFQSARFFWTPEKEIPVTLEEIGRVHLETTGLDKTLLKAIKD